MLSYQICATQTIILKCYLMNKQLSNLSFAMKYNSVTTMTLLRDTKYLFHTICTLLFFSYTIRKNRNLANAWLVEYSVQILYLIF